MAEMNIKQIIDRLNAEFTGDTRKLVFWYDDNGEFVEDMQNVELDNAKVYFLQPDNQFATKLFLERQDTTTNYLIYAPFPKPDVRTTIWKILCSTLSASLPTALRCFRWIWH